MHEAHTCVWPNAEQIYFYGQVARAASSFCIITTIPANCDRLNENDRDKQDLTKLAIQCYLICCCTDTISFLLIVVKFSSPFRVLIRQLVLSDHNIVRMSALFFHFIYLLFAEKKTDNLFVY